MSSGRLKAKVKPELLVWARESARMIIEVAADKAKVDAAQLRQWEAGGDRPSLAQLRKLAEVYKRPLVVFYLPTPPSDFDALRDFRRLPETATDESPVLAFEIRWAQEMREVAIEAFAAAEIEYPALRFEVPPGTPVAKAAKLTREQLGISVADQQAFKDDYKAFNAWRASLERLGVLCFQFSGVEVEVARAFSIPAKPLPVIAVNTKDAITARTFSMLHEFTHLALGSGGMCDLHEEGSAERDRIEIYCNAVAGEVLVPSAALRSEDLVRGSTTARTWAASALRTLANRYHVSQEVVLRRLLDMGLTTDSFYRQRRDEFREIRRKTDDDSGGGDYYRNQRAKLGTPLIRGVMAAWHAGQITANEAAAYLRVKVTSLPRLLEAAA